MGNNRKEAGFQPQGGGFWSSWAHLVNNYKSQMQATNKKKLLAGRPLHRIHVEGKEGCFCSS
jgi:hypothetical protein